eukprot:gene27221-34870_t
MEAWSTLLSADDVAAAAEPCAAYMATLLWTITMYVEASCPNFSHQLPAGFQTPSAPELLRHITGGTAAVVDAASKCSRSKAAPPTPHACAVAMLPASAVRLVPEPLQPLFEATSEIARFFEAERCEECKRLRRDLQLLEVLRAEELRAQGGADLQKVDPGVNMDTFHRDAVAFAAIMPDNAFSWNDKTFYYNKNVKLGGGGGGGGSAGGGGDGSTGGGNTSGVGKKRSRGGGQSKIASDYPDSVLVAEMRGVRDAYEAHRAEAHLHLKLKFGDLASIGAAVAKVPISTFSEVHAAGASFGNVRRYSCGSGTSTGGKYGEQCKKSGCFNIVVGGAVARGLCEGHTKGKARRHAEMAYHSIHQQYGSGYGGHSEGHAPGGHWDRGGSGNHNREGDGRQYRYIQPQHNHRDPYYNDRGPADRRGGGGGGGGGGVGGGSGFNDGGYGRESDEGRRHGYAFEHDRFGYDRGWASGSSGGGGGGGYEDPGSQY